MVRYRRHLQGDLDNWEWLLRPSHQGIAQGDQEGGRHQTHRRLVQLSVHFQKSSQRNLDHEIVYQNERKHLYHKVARHNCTELCRFQQSIYGYELPSLRSQKVVQRLEAGGVHVHRGALQGRVL